MSLLSGAPRSRRHLLFSLDKSRSAWQSRPRSRRSLCSFVGKSSCLPSSMSCRYLGSQCPINVALGHVLTHVLLLCRPGFSNTAMTYIICNHEWSFLEGEKKHSHTLKAGRHLFPFQLSLGGSLPSTLSIGAHGGASITYKLRAIATRPGFALNLKTQKAIRVLRSLARESLEYQQSLELENTWPEKVMYSIMVPHKAWAAGDDLTAVVKFSPLAKGVRVLSVVTTLNETTKICSRSGWQESTKPV